MTWRCFTVRGTPVAQPRPRAKAIGRSASVYTPKKHPVNAWKALVREAARMRCHVAPGPGPVRVQITFDMPRPLRLMRKKDPEGCVVHTSTPDADNLAKSTLDALTEAEWWLDDAQVNDLRVVKRYHAKRGWPGATVVVWWSSEA